MSSKSSLRVKSKNLTKAFQGSCLSLPAHPLALSLQALTLPPLSLLLPLRLLAGSQSCWTYSLSQDPRICCSLCYAPHTSSVSCSHLFRGPPRPPCQPNSPIWHLSSCFIFFPSIFHPLMYYKCICLCLYGPSFLDSKLYEGRHCPQEEAIEVF